METRDLIQLLSRRAHAVEHRHAPWRWAAGMGSGLLVAVALLWPRMPVGSGREAMAARTAYGFDIAIATALGAAALSLAMRLGQPGGPVRRGWLLLALPLGWLALVGAMEWSQMPAGVPDTSWRMFVTHVLWLYVPIFTAACWCMRGQAPTRLAPAGAAAGALAGALATLVCMLFGLDLAMSPWPLWHVLGVAVPALAGTLLGPTVLRW